MVPWSTGAEDKDADGKLLDFSVKQGTGTRLTEGEKEDVKRERGDCSSSTSPDHRF